MKNNLVNNLKVIYKLIYMNIEEVAKFEPKIENGKLIVYVTVLGIEITDLRILRFLTKLENLLNELANDKIKEFFFVFNIDEMIIPTKFTMLENFANMFIKHRKTILDKLNFSVVQSKSNIFKMFFGLFKSHYEPIKPLYLCTNESDVASCIFEPETRSKYPNIINMISQNK
jgi:hypothetical protein